MLRDLIKDTVLQQLGTLRSSPKGWATRDCPLCHHRGHSRDRKGRFGMLISSDGGIVVKCFHCFFKAFYIPGRLLSNDFVWFLQTIGVPEQDIRKLKFEAFREKETGNAFYVPTLAGNAKSKWVPMDLPENSFTLSTWKKYGCCDENFLKVYDYAVDRKLNPDDFYWSTDPNRDINQRVLIPFIYREKIIGYSGRHCLEDVTPKYYNITPSDFVYNLDRQMCYGRRFTILCEGIIDAYVVDGVSCLGNELSKEQISILEELDTQLIVCPDRDSAGDMLVETALEYGWPVAFPKWGRGIKDAGKAAQVYGRLLTVRSIIESAESNPLKITVKRKMDKL